MPDIVITEFMDAAPVECLRARYDVHWDTALWSKRAELERLVGDARALVVRNRTRVDHELIANAGRLEVVGRLGVGLDNIDLDACHARAIAVCPATGANAVSVAEYVISAAIVLLRGGALAMSARLAAGEWPREEAGRGRELAGKWLGVVGFGAIGQLVGERARALGMRVLACDAYLPESHPAWQAATRSSLDELLCRADIVTLHVPLTPETRGLVGKDRIERMKKDAILVNTARGGILDEAACAQALRSGQLGGAALDVFEAEPISPETGRLFAGLHNVILTPHVAGLTLESNVRTSHITVDNVLSVLEARR